MPLRVFTRSGMDYDMIDEALYFFKANIFFKNYEIKVWMAIIQLKSIVIMLW